MLETCTRRSNGCCRVTERRKVRGSNPQGLIQPRRFSRALPSPIGLTFRAAGCGNDFRNSPSASEISFTKQCCKSRCAGFQVLRESQENQGEAWFSFPQPGRFCTTTSQQPRCAVGWLRKRFYVGMLGKHQQHAGGSNRQQRSHSGPPPHRPCQGDLSAQAIETSGAASVTRLLLDFYSAKPPVGVGVHISLSR